MAQKKKKRQRIMDRAKTFLYDLPEDEFKDLTVTMVAERLGVTPGSLSMACKRHTGNSIEHYLIFHKTRIASMMMYRNPYISIKKVVETLDMSSSSYLARIFKKRYGVTPKEYCNQQKKQIEEDNIKVQQIMKEYEMKKKEEKKG